MSKNIETLSCVFVTKEESKNFIQNNNLQKSPIECSLKIKTMDGYVYCNRELFLSDILSLKEEKKLNKAICINNVSSLYDEYIFYYDGKRIIIKMPNNNVDDWLDSSRNKLNHIVDVLVKCKRRKALKSIVLSLALAGTISTSISIALKSDKNKANSYEKKDIYSEYYEDVMSKSDFDELVNNMQESYNKSIRK